MYICIRRYLKMYTYMHYDIMCSLHTSECVNQFRRLHLIQVGSTIPRSRHHLSASHQPISCDHYTLVALQGCCSDPDGGDLARALAIHLAFFSV